MKYKGDTLSKNFEIIVIPRATGEIVFRAEAVTDYAEFDKVVPKPEPAKIMLPGGKLQLDPSDDYDARRKEYLTQRYNFLILKSLCHSDGIEWEKAKLEDPTTWHLAEDELKDSHFTRPEIELIFDGISKANGLNAEHIERAKETFILLQQLQAEPLSFPMGEPSNIPSGEPVSD